MNVLSALGVLSALMSELLILCAYVRADIGEFDGALDALLDRMHWVHGRLRVGSR